MTMVISEWNNPVVIATLILAGVTVFLAVAAFRSIRENRRIRAEDMKLASTRRQTDEVQKWMIEVFGKTHPAHRGQPSYPLRVGEKKQVTCRRQNQQRKPQPAPSPMGRGGEKSRGAQIPTQ